MNFIIINQHLAAIGYQVAAFLKANLPLYFLNLT